MTTVRPAPDGTERVYVVELEIGDMIYGTNEIVDKVKRINDHRTIVTMTDGHVSSYRSGHSTVLVVRTKHEWQYARFTGNKTCAKCGLLPIDSDDEELPCCGTKHGL